MYSEKSPEYGGRLMTQRQVDTLTTDECRDRLESQEIGRVVFIDEEGPAALPVNYGIAGDEIIMRVARGSHLRQFIEKPVAFEVDYTDSEQASGWSVLVRGSGREVPLPEVHTLLEQMHDKLPRPWAEGVHSTWLAIRIGSMTGRRLSGEIRATLF